MKGLISPHGGSLSDLMLEQNEVIKARANSVNDLSIELTDAQLCDLELLMNGAFSPLRGFLGRADYESVLERMRLSDGTVWPIPIMLAIHPGFAEGLAVGQYVALRDQEGAILARLKVEELWRPDLTREAEAVFGTDNPTHPGVGHLFIKREVVYVGGPVEGLEMPRHYDFKGLRYTPTELRHEFSRRGWRHIVGFQIRNPIHRAHKEMTVRAATDVGAHLLLHPVVGLTKLGDIDHFTRVRCYLAISEHYPPGLMMVSLLNLAMRMAGPREALWHAIIRKNHGCSHFIVGRDHAGPGTDENGAPFYSPYSAQDIVAKYEQEIGIKMILFQEIVYVPSKAQYLPVNEVEPRSETLKISGTELRRRLKEGLEIPEWFSYSSVVEELRRAYPSKEKQGFTLFFTGLSGAGKSTIAKILLAKFLEIGGRPVTLLDGDIVRKNLSSELGFSKAHRELNIMRIGFVAKEITKNGGIAICAPIAPYESARQKVREIISVHGAFIEIYVSTPLEVCEQRDRKGFYAKARAGVIKDFTGINDPYEPPKEPEINLDTTTLTPEEAAQEVWLYLEREKYLI